jgi:hypothetical protein
MLPEQRASNRIMVAVEILAVVALLAISAAVILGVAPILGRVMGALAGQAISP